MTFAPEFRIDRQEPDGPNRPVSRGMHVVRTRGEVVVPLRGGRTRPRRQSLRIREVARALVDRLLRDPRLDSRHDLPRPCRRSRGELGADRRGARSRPGRTTANGPRTSTTCGPASGAASPAGPAWTMPGTLKRSAAWSRTGRPPGRTRRWTRAPSSSRRRGPVTSRAAGRREAYRRAHDPRQRPRPRPRRRAPPWRRRPGQRSARPRCAWRT